MQTSSCKSSLVWVISGHTVHESPGVQASENRKAMQNLRENEK